LVLIDALKIGIVCEHFKNNTALSVHWSSFLLKHATHRPEAYESYYSSVETLLQFASSYVTNGTPRGPRRSQNQFYVAFHSLDEAVQLLGNHHPLLVDIVEAVGIKELQDDEVIVYYHGENGKEIMFLSNVTYFVNKLLQNNLSLSVDKDGYIVLIKECIPLHIDIMRRFKAHASDGLIVDHSNCVRVDDRFRNLRVVPRWFNNMNRKNVHGIDKHGNQYRVTVNLVGRYRRVPFYTYNEAFVAREYIIANVYKIIAKLEKEDMKDKELATYITMELDKMKMLANH
jgi:hypothetical protein